MMKKAPSIISMSLLAASLIMPSVRSYADDPPGNHEQREELRRDQRQLDELQRRRNEERREGDKGDAREYNGKIHEQKREIRNDRKDIEGNKYDGRRHDGDRHDDHD